MRTFERKVIAETEMEEKVNQKGKECKWSTLVRTGKTKDLD